MNNLTLTLSPMEFRDCLAHVHCMGLMEFNDAFSSIGRANYYWDKFDREYGKDACRFICYLDSAGLFALVVYLDKYNKKLRHCASKKGVTI